MGTAEDIKIGDTLYSHSNWHGYYGNEIVGETPKRWELDNGQVCTKDELRIVGDRYSKMQTETPEILLIMKRQNLQRSISQKINTISSSRNKLTSDIDKLKDITGALEHLIKTMEIKK